MGWFYSHMGSTRRGDRVSHGIRRVLGAAELGLLAGQGMGRAPWILPTLVGIPGIAFGTRYYKKLFNRHAPAAPPKREEPLEQASAR